MERDEISVEEVRALLEGATPGPWNVYQHFATPLRDRFDVVGATRDDDVAENVHRANVDFIAAAPSIARAYLALSGRVGELEAALAGEPTKAMIEAGVSVLDDCLDHDWDSGGDGEGYNSYTTIRSDAPSIVYKAMVAALSHKGMDHG